MRRIGENCLIGGSGRSACGLFGKGLRPEGLSYSSWGPFARLRASRMTGSGKFMKDPRAA
jgi:hypothetical protein